MSRRIVALLLTRSRAAGERFPYQFQVVATLAINAHALPGGFLFVNAGAIMAARNEGELAGVMAHEIAHAALRHGTNKLSPYGVDNRIPSPEA
jgi:predicted Zn-dependent protease